VTDTPQLGEAAAGCTPKMYMALDGVGEWERMLQLKGEVPGRVTSQSLLLQV